VVKVARGIHSLGTGEDRVAVRTELPTDPLSTNISWQSILLPQYSDP